MATTPTYIDSNSAIIERCKKGDRKAFYELYSLYNKAMFNISLRILNNTFEAEEVLQDSFLKAFQNIQIYNSNHLFGAWLKKIVINGSLDALKKRKPKLVSIDEIGLSLGEENEAYDNEDEIEFDVETIKKCVSQLPDGYRTVLSLFLFEDYSHKEIAELLGINEGTSKSQYNRAKKKLIELILKTTTTNER